LEFHKTHLLWPLLPELEGFPCLRHAAQISEVIQGAHDLTQLAAFASTKGILVAVWGWSAKPSVLVGYSTVGGEGKGPHIYTCTEGGKKGRDQVMVRLTISFAG
jgi:hypothetical protein